MSYKKLVTIRLWIYHGTCSSVCRHLLLMLSCMWNSLTLVCPIKLLSLSLICWRIWNLLIFVSVHFDLLRLYKFLQNTWHIMYVFMSYTNINLTNKNLMPIIIFAVFFIVFWRTLDLTKPIKKVRAWGSSPWESDFTNKKHA